MKLNTISFQKYKNLLGKMGLDFSLLINDIDGLERLDSFIYKMDSNYLLPSDNDVELKDYSKKLIENAYNFILVEDNNDISILSIYVNDLLTKTAYCSSIGILPTHQGRNIAPILIDFGIQFSKEMGMELIKAEVNKSNSKMITLFTRYDFHISSETEKDSYIIIKELNVP